MTYNQNKHSNNSICQSYNSSDVEEQLDYEPPTSDSNSSDPEDVTDSKQETVLNNVSSSELQSEQNVSGSSSV